MRKVFCQILQKKMRDNENQRKYLTAKFVYFDRLKVFTNDYQYTEV